jgi:hypothetical protein
MRPLSKCGAKVDSFHDMAKQNEEKTQCEDEKGVRSAPSERRRTTFAMPSTPPPAADGK